MKKIAVIFLIAFIFLTIANFALAKEKTVNLYFFYGDTCPHCKKAEKFLEKLEKEEPQLEIKRYEVFNNQENAQLLLKLFENCGEEKKVRVPAIFIGKEVIIGFLDEETTGLKIEKAIKDCLDKECPDPLGVVDECQYCQCQGKKGELCQCQTCTCPIEEKEDQIIDYPLIGKVNLSRLSLPVLTVAVSALDGFNPCAMGLLIFLIALLINLPSRKKIWLLGGTFILASGAVYYLLLTAWLNLFLAISYVSLTRMAIGVAAIFFGSWQIKRFVTFKPGVCTVTEKSSRLENGLRSQAEKIVNHPVLIASVLGVIVLALAVNLIEFFCSAGLPAIYTRILSLSHLNPVSYHLYLLLYTFIFMLDDMIVFVIAVITLSKIGFTDKYNKWATLIGGILILLLGLLMIFKPSWLVFG